MLGTIEIESVPATPTAEPAAAAENADSTWNLVVLEDSLVVVKEMSVLPEAYAAYLKEDLGIEVEIQNLAVGGETTGSLLANLKYPWYREPLEEAEIVLSP